MRENKLFLTILSIAFVLLIASISMNFLFVNGNYEYGVSSSKTFNIELEKQQGTNEFVFSTKNHLRSMESISKFISNVSVIVYDLDNNPDNQSEIFELMESPTDVKFGFLEQDENLFKRSSYYGHKFLFNAGLGKERNMDAQIKNIEKLVSLIKKYDTGLYVTPNEIRSLKGNSALANLLIDLKPFIISGEDECNDKIKVCFLSDTKNLKIQAPLKLQEILNNQIKSNDKWFIVVKYNKAYMKDIKKLIKDVNGGFLNVSESVLKQILST